MAGGGIRELLLLIFALVWAVVTITVAVANKGDVPPALWAVLAGGVAGILTAFRVGGGDDKGGKE